MRRAGAQPVVEIDRGIGIRGGDAEVDGVVIVARQETLDDGVAFKRRHVDHLPVGEPAAVAQVVHPVLWGLHCGQCEQVCGGQIGDVADGTRGGQ